jgi:protein-tyrosine-phosphatase
MEGSKGTEGTSPRDPLRVLFVCTGNSARSQIAEALLRHFSHGGIEVSSAGSEPKPEIHPQAVAAIRKLYRLSMEGQRPKSFDEVGGKPYDYVITLCDRAAEHCPIFPGAPERIHWGYPDPAAGTKSPEETQRAFERTATDIAARLRTWLSLPSIGRHLRTDARG